MSYGYEQGLSYTLWLLGRRDHSEAELRERLQRKGAEPSDIGRIVQRLRELELVDDESFATRWVRARSRKKGAIAIRHELKRKGVGEAHVDRALAELTDEGQVEAAVAVLERNAWRFRERDLPARARAYAMLARRGFAADVAGEALRRSGLFEDT